MPKCPGNGTVIIEEGDSLWKAAKFVLQYEGKPTTNTQIANLVNKIVKLNNISNPNLVYAGQVFKLYESAGTSNSSSSENKSNAPVITSMGIQSGTERNIFATWTWYKHDSTKEYEYEYYYDTGDSLEWFYGGGTTCGTRQHVVFTPPENAKRVKFMVRPIAKSSKEGS